MALYLEDVVRIAQDALVGAPVAKCDSCGATEDNGRGLCAYCRRPRPKTPPMPIDICVETEYDEIRSWGDEVVIALPRRTVTMRF